MTTTPRDLRYHDEAHRQRERAEFYRDLAIGLAALITVQERVDVAEFFTDDADVAEIARRIRFIQRDVQDAARP